MCYHLQSMPAPEAQLQQQHEADTGKTRCQMENILYWASVYGYTKMPLNFSFRCFLLFPPQLHTGGL